MGTIDWAIVAVCMIVLSAFTFRAVRYMKGVSDFLSAGRSAGRFMQCFASAMSGVGAMSLVAIFEMYYVSGFTPIWWQMMFWPIGMFLTLSGWVYYRFRETRCMTMAQFFEVRYSKSFRIYAGLITWASGIINFGIFPAVACRFIVHFCGLPENFLLMGYNIPTFVPIMVITLILAVTYTNLGGQVTVILTDCVQGMFCGILFLGVAMFLMHKFSWVDITAALKTAPADKSMLNPANTSGAAFAVWFFLIQVFYLFYGTLAWQGSQAYNCSSLNPHEQKMASVIAVWSGPPKLLVYVLLPICAFVFMTLPKYAGESAVAHQVLSEIDNTVIAKQVTTSVALGLMFPTGLKGLFCAAIIFFLITTQDTYLHSWGSIFIQDVVLPFRKKPFTPKQQIRLLRWSIFFVAAFAFLFSLFYKQNEFVLMFLAITGAIVAGAGAVIVGGLYFKWGTSAGAWVAMTVGWVMAVGSIIIKQIAPLFKNITDRGPLLLAMDWLASINGQYIWFWTMFSCLVSYLLVSLLTCRQPFNLHKMLHRGKYDIAKDHVKAKDASKSVWGKILGITDEFTRSDRILAIMAVVWNLGLAAVFAIGTVLMFTVGLSDETCSRFWQIWAWVYLSVGVPAMIWFTWGGIRDIRRLFARLSTMKRDERDDGRVVEHHSVVDEDVQ